MSALNIVLIVLATVTLLLSALLPLFKKTVKDPDAGGFYNGFVRFIDKKHILVGVLAVNFSVIHAVISDMEFFKITWGTVSIYLLILCKLPLVIHKKDQKDLGLLLHIILSFIALVTLVLHVIEKF